MNPIERFAAYAAAFERTFETDDFSHIEPFFTEDAVYETRGAPGLESCSEGREAVFAYLKDSLEGLDRRFDTRALRLLEGPTQRGDAVWMRWAARYTKAGLPDLEIAGEETATFRGDRIARLEDVFSPDAAKGLNEYLQLHAAALGVEA